MRGQDDFFTSVGGKASSALTSGDFVGNGMEGKVGMLHVKGRREASLLKKMG